MNSYLKFTPYCPGFHPNKSDAIAIKKNNNFHLLFGREVSRTEGISTTDLVGRMLLLTKNHFRQGEKEYAIEKEGDRSKIDNRKKIQ